VLSVPVSDLTLLIGRTKGIWPSETFHYAHTFSFRAPGLADYSRCQPELHLKEILSAECFSVLVTESHGKGCNIYLLRTELMDQERMKPWLIYLVTICSELWNVASGFSQCFEFHSVLIHLCLCKR